MRFKESLSKNKACLNSAQGSLRVFQLRERMSEWEASVETLSKTTTTLDQFEMTEETFALLRETWHQDSKDFQAIKSALTDLLKQGKRDDLDEEVLQVKTIFKSVIIKFVTLKQHPGITFKITDRI